MFEVPGFRLMNGFGNSIIFALRSMRGFACDISGSTNGAVFMTAAGSTFPPASKEPLPCDPSPRGATKENRLPEKQQCRRATTHRFGGTVQSNLLVVLLALLVQNVKQIFSMH
jgi:hypothetical protein